MKIVTIGLTQRSFHATTFSLDAAIYHHTVYFRFIVVCKKEGKMPAAIEIKNLSKKFDLPVKPPEGVSKLLPIGLMTARTCRDFWALRDINLIVESGKMLGLIGRNGSGKSTLLKIISGILHPTTGSVRTIGRVTALLELGAGFHEELSGMENIFLSGAILGLSRKEIFAVLPAIIEFSGLADFMDTPLKHYSSGMQARLGFSIAAHMNPEILLIDEALSVGDMEFQSRCIERIGEFRKNGKTIVFVTHEIDLANYICDEIAWMEDGRIRDCGSPDLLCQEYRRAFHKDARSDLNAATEASPLIDDIIQSVRVLSQSGDKRAEYNAQEPLDIEIVYNTKGAILEHPAIRLLITRADNLAISDIRSDEVGFAPESLHGSGRIIIRFRPLLLLKGSYEFSVFIYDRTNPAHIYARHLR
ncbi:MAG TPA: ABC transporter ATP-binding protein, partial [Candidatus Sumerlaeia bacterium]|nr:ABC transporter ATP-binding protein [Candidatus Sumerlaeia bacterium]